MSEHKTPVLLTAHEATPPPPAQEPLIETLRAAVARGWCSPENAHKEMDAALAEAIVRQVYAAVACLPCDDCDAAPPAQELLREARENLLFALSCQSWPHVRDALNKMDAALSPSPNNGTPAATTPLGWLVPNPTADHGYLFSKTNVDNRQHWIPVVASSLPANAAPHEHKTPASGAVADHEAPDGAGAFANQIESYSDAHCKGHDDCPLPHAAFDAAIRLLRSPPVPGRTPEPQEWRPIATAPKDGTLVLVWIPGEFERADFATWANSAISGDMDDTSGPAWRDNVLRYPLETQPTHWMPLPSPPASPVSNTPTTDDAAASVSGEPGPHHLASLPRVPK